MNFLLVSVKDTVTGEYMNPVPVHNEDEGKRLFAYQISSNPMWKENPEQFEMYVLCSFDTETGEIAEALPFPENFCKPSYIAKGIDLIDKRKE